jgi:hypothetical protein
VIVMTIWTVFLVMLVAGFAFEGGRLCAHLLWRRLPAWVKR